jgi:hypothetical protein
MAYFSRFVRECFVWSKEGIWGYVGSIALLAGLVLAVAQYHWPQFTVTQSMNGFWNGVIPIAAGASVFGLRLCAAPFVLWKKEVQRAATLSDQLTATASARPLLRPEHHISIIGSRMVEQAMMSLGPWSNCAYRLQVNNDGPINATGCHGVISEIQKEGETTPRWGGNNVRLTFAPSRDGDSLAKTVHANGGHEWLDVIFLEFLNSRYLRVGKMGIRDAQDWPQPTVEQIFRDEGVYYFLIQIRSDQLPPLPIRIRFNFIMWPDASEMEIVL